MLIAENHSVDGSNGDYEWIPAPDIGRDMAYVQSGVNRPIRVYRKIDQRSILEDLYAKLEMFAEREGGLGETREPADRRCTVGKGRTA